MSNKRAKHERLRAFLKDPGHTVKDLFRPRNLLNSSKHTPSEAMVGGYEPMRNLTAMDSAIQLGNTHLRAPYPPATYQVSGSTQPLSTMLHSDYSKSTCLRLRPMYMEPDQSIAWAGFKKFASTINEAAAAFGPLKSLAGEFPGFIENLDKIASGWDDYGELRAELNELFEDMSNYLTGPVSPIITPSIASLAQALIQLLRQGGIGGRTICHVRPAFDDSEVRNTCRQVRRLLGRLALNLNLNAWKSIDEQRAENNLKSLPYAHAATYDSRESINVHRSGCTPDTRRDVLETLQTWAGDTSNKPICWLSGMAGTGKTTIAYSLCERLERDGKLAASFFCSRQLPSCRDVTRILPSISVQLAKYSRPWKHAISEVLEQNPNVLGETLATQLDKLVVAPLRNIGHTLPNNLVVVIDALDECDDSNGIDRILGALLSCVLDLPIKFFVTSRPDARIMARMRTEQAQNEKAELRLHELSHSVVQEDIKNYLESQLKPLNPSAADLNSLVERSGVLFIYAATIVRYIAYNDYSRGLPRLKQVLGTTDISTHPSDQKLDALYSTILASPFDESGLDSFERDEISRVLYTVLCAREPLSTDTIAGLLRLDVPSVRTSLRPLLSVLSVSDTSGLVTTLHESFQDYMFDQARSGRLYCDSRRHNEWFARRCFELIGAAPPFNICQLESSFMMDQDVHDLDMRVKAAIPQELFYACRHLGDHMELAAPSEALVALLSEFLSTRLMLWMEVLNLNQCTHDGAGVLYRLQLWIEKNKCSKDMGQIARDAWKFVTAYASSPISKSTPHIYVSALTLWPKDKPISMLYSKSLRSHIDATGTAMRPRGLAPLLVRTLDSSAGCITYSPNGDIVASGCYDGTIDVWDVHTGQKVGQTFEGHKCSVSSVAFSPDGIFMVSGSSDFTVRIWETSTGRPCGKPLEAHTNRVNSVAYSPDGAYIISGSSDCTIRMWNARTGNIVGQPLKGHTDRVSSVIYSPNGAYISSCSSDKSIGLWDAFKGHLLGLLEGHTGRVNTIAYSPNGSYVVSGSDDRTIRIWDAHTMNQVVQPFKGHTGWVASVAYSPDGKHIVSGSSDCTVRIWDVFTGQQLGQPLDGHTDTVNTVIYSPSGSRIVSGSEDRTVHIWDVHAINAVEQPLEGHTGWVTSVAYSPDGMYIATGSSDCTIRIWNARTGMMEGQPLEGHLHSIRSVAFSPSGRNIVSGSSDCTIRIWDAQTCKTIGQPMKGHTNWVRSVAYAPDGSRVVSGSHDGTIRIWDASTGQMFDRPLNGHTSWVTSVAYSPDGAKIASGCYDCTISLWDSYTGQTLGQPLIGHTGWINSVAFSPNNMHIASGSVDCTVRIWDVYTGKPVGIPLVGHTNWVTSVAYSPDGAYIASGSDDGTIRIWSVATGQIIGKPLEGHMRSVHSVAYSPDGTYIISGSDDETIRIWNSPQGFVTFRPGDWNLNQDGWVIDDKQQPLIWIPPGMRGVLLRPQNAAVISRYGSLHLGLDGAAIGTRWAQSFCSREVA